MSKRWLGLDGLVPKLRKLVAAALPPDRREMTRDELKFKASAIAKQFSTDTGNSDEIVGMVNLAMLALLTNAQPPTWLCRPSASRVVHGTDLHSIPTQPPRIMRVPGLIEARRPETGERLWGDIASLGWYSLGDQWWLMGLSYPDGYQVVRWLPQWTGKDLDEQLPALDLTALVPLGERETYYDFAHQAARYLLVFALLAESDPSPLRIVLDKSDQTRRRRDVYFDDRQPPPRPRNENPVPLLEGKMLADVDVSGHLKRQRYGEALSKTKWIYVQGFSARRWVSRRWLVSQLGTGEID